MALEKETEMKACCHLLTNHVLPGQTRLQDVLTDASPHLLHLNNYGILLEIDHTNSLRLGKPVAPYL